MLEGAEFQFKVLLTFLFDSGIRAPTELMNVRVEDLEWEASSAKFMLRIRDESSKTFGRRIRLMLSSELLKRYLQVKPIRKGERLFKLSPITVNRNLRLLSESTFGTGLVGLEENPGTKERLTMYDFRHASACFYLPRYRSETQMKYRFGWASSKMIRYYTHFLGMVDTISEEDMLV
jgi:integrase